jgi:hypothetical protein
MPLKNLQDFVSSEDGLDTSLENTKEFEQLKNMLESSATSKTRWGKNKRKWKHFWYSWDSCRNERDHEKRKLLNSTWGPCCFTDVIGRPKKGNKEMPFLPYQKLLYQTLKRYKQIWIKKARGIGVTTFLLYWLLYKSLTEWGYNDRILVVTGPRERLAEDFVLRYKSLFREKFPAIYSQLIKQSKTSAVVNSVKLEAFPSHHVDAMRGYVNVRAIIVDEADYFPPGQQQQVSAVLSGYLAKPNASPTIILCSTPASPNGLMQQIELDQNSLYYKMFLPYQYGLEGSHPIYDREQIELAKRSPDFSREYEGQYLGLVGNVFSPQKIIECTQRSYNPDLILPNLESEKSLGIDPSFGSSKFALVLTQYSNERIEVLVAEEHDRPDINAMLDRVWELHQKYKISAIYCDSANPEVWQSLKKMFNENHNEKYVSEKLLYYEKSNLNPASYMKVVPVAFSKYGAAMLTSAKRLIEHDDGLVAIHPKFESLLVALGTATAEGGRLLKDKSSNHDILDAFRLSCQYYKLSE